MYDPTQLTSSIQRLRETFRVARDVAAGTDGDPIAAAKLLAAGINHIGTTIAAGFHQPALQAKFFEVAPLFAIMRQETPAAFAELRQLFAELGVPPLLDDLPTHWNLPPGDVLETAYNLGLSLGFTGAAVTAAAPTLTPGAQVTVDDLANRIEEEVDLTAVVMSALGKVGITPTQEAAFHVVNEIMLALGYQPVPDGPPVTGPF